MQVKRWFATDIHTKWGKSLGPRRGEKTGILSNENIEDKKPRDNSGNTPLDAARTGNHLKVVDFMERYNVEPKTKRRKVKKLKVLYPEN